MIRVDYKHNSSAMLPGDQRKPVRPSLKQLLSGASDRIHSLVTRLKVRLKPN